MEILEFGISYFLGIPPNGSKGLHAMMPGLSGAEWCIFILIAIIAQLCDTIALKYRDYPLVATAEISVFVVSS